MSETGNCVYCNGRGWNWYLPIGTNPFDMKIEAISQVTRKITCDSCFGSGYSKTPSEPHQEHRKANDA